MTSTATSRRIRVLDLRIRLERVGAKAFDDVCQPAQTGRQSATAKRLIFLVGLVDAARQPDIHRLAKLGGHVYRRTSDVLHGRLNALDLTDVMIDEWRTVVDDLELVMIGRPSSG